MSFAGDWSDPRNSVCRRRNRNNRKKTICENRRIVVILTGRTLLPLTALAIGKIACMLRRSACNTPGCMFYRAAVLLL
jgi:preprotein translocase subunit Sec63